MWIVLRAVYTLTPSYIFAAIFVYVFVHHIHLWTHSDVIFYTYTHLWMYSGLYSATATFSRSFSCTFSYSHAYTHLRTHSNVSILHLYSPVPVDVQRSLQCYSYIFVAIFVYIFVHPRLHSSVDAHVCVAYILRFSGPSLALFSRWQRVHGYTSLIRPRFHSSLHSTPTFSEHFRDPGVYKYSTFYIYILRTFSYIRQCSEPSDFYTIILHFANIFVKFLASLLSLIIPPVFTFFFDSILSMILQFVDIFSEHFRRDFSKFLDFFIRFSRTLRQYCVYIYI